MFVCLVGFYVCLVDWLVGWLVLCLGLLNYITRQRVLPMVNTFHLGAKLPFLSCASVQDLFTQAGPVSTKVTVYLPEQVGPSFTPFNHQKREHRVPAALL